MTNVIFLSLITTVLTFAATVIAIIQIYSIFHEKKKQRFKLINKYMNSDSRSLCNEALMFYKENYVKDDKIKVEAMVFLEGWMHEKGKGLIKIDDVKIHPIANKAVMGFDIRYKAIKQAFKKKRILPSININLTDNALICLA